jgi:K+:H+ antiporter
MAAQHRGVVRSAATSVTAPALVRTSLGYVLMVLVAVGVFLVIRRYGETLTAPSPRATVAETFGQQPDVLLHVLVALAAVIITGRVLARLFAQLGQPPVIGEVLAGILLGPSLLGAERSAVILPPAIAPSLGVIAQLGVILYMFIVGLELNASLLRARAHAVIATSHASILTPFVLGAGLSLALYPRLSTSNVPFTSFALFMGVAMSITAFPVLARILTDQRMSRSELGVIALSCAATDDVTAWCLLALVVGVANARVGDGLRVVAGALAYVGCVLFVVRPIVRRIAARWSAEPLSRAAVAWVFVGLLLSTIATETIGIHAIFGAFLLGAVLPHDSALATTFVRKLEDIVTVLLLPAFFALTGMRTQIGLVSGLDKWAICVAIIVVATVGKFGGTYAAARLTGLDARPAAALGALMNTRGLMELIVLNVGLDLGVISPTLFAMMVLMALATTMVTAPALRWLVPDAVGTDPS